MSDCVMEFNDQHWKLIDKITEDPPPPFISLYNNKYRLEILPDDFNNSVKVTVLNIQTNERNGRHYEANGDIIYIGWSSNFNDNDKNIKYEEMKRVKQL